MCIRDRAIHVVLFGLLRLGPQTTWWRLGVAMLGSLYWYYLLLLYALNWFSHLNWGSNVMFDFITHLPQQIISIATTEGISLVWVLTAILALWLLLMCLAIWLVKRLPAVSNAADSLALKPLVYNGMFLLFVAGFVFLTYSRDDPREWVFEPLLSSVALNSSAFLNNRSKIQVLQDQRIKQALTPQLNDFTGSTNVILIIADALRADRLPGYGYQRPTTPFLSQLQAEPGYQQVAYFTSTCSESICGIYSVLISRI